MVFSSLIFIFKFLPVFLLAYYLSPVRYRNWVAMLASCAFYAWGAPRFLFVLLATSTLDYHLSAQLHSGQPERRRKRILALAVAINLVALLYFKYANFFVEQTDSLLAHFGFGSLAWTRVALPIGISFFTFQKISYLVDVYRGTAQRARSLHDYVLYVILFPQLIAGPIVRYHDVAMQLIRRDHTSERFFAGIWRFSIGLGKKVLIANSLAAVADRGFGMKVSELTPGFAWLGVVCYAFQIYFDFSGYSDMAIGLGRMMGFEFLENFNCPYVARNFTEFWRRWHISLSNFMREYVYIPLGGNRVGAFRGYFNLWIVFVLSGFWHGAAWNFVVWGAYHGFFLTLDKMTRNTRWARMPLGLAIPINFVLVLFSWVLFRAESLGSAVFYFQRMFALPSLAAAQPMMAWSEFITPHAWTVLAIAAAIVFAPAFTSEVQAPRQRITTATRPWPLTAQFVAACLLLFLSAAALATGGFNPFIYFRF